MVSEFAIKDSKSIIKGYKLYNLDSKTVFLSRDVFHESIFPFHCKDFYLQSHSSISTGSLFPSPPPLVLDFPDIDHVPTSSLPLDLPTLDSSLANTVAPLPAPSTSSNHPTIQPSRHSTRPHKAPAYLKDFHCQTVSITHSVPTFPIEFVISYDNFSSPHRAFTLALSVTSEPKSYLEASRDPRWQATMNAEIATLEANQTWFLTPCQLAKCPLDVNGFTK